MIFILYYSNQKFYYFYPLIEFKPLLKKYLITCDKILSEKEDKLLVRRDTLNLRRKYGRTQRVNVIERDAFIPAGIEEDIKNDILNRKAILASDIAVKYDIRVSTAKNLLEKYEDEGLVEILDPSLKLKIYVPKS